MKKIKTEHVVFALYIAVLLWLILFKLAFRFEDILSLAGERKVNLIPFYYDNEVNIRHHIKEAMMNFIVFIPFGIYLKIFGVSFVKGTFWAGATSLSLELIQLAFAIGGADITDLITNTLGAAAGIFIYLLSTKIFKNEKKLKNTVNITAFILFSIFIALMIITWPKMA